MSMTNSVMRYGAARLSRRLSGTIPFVGVLIAFFALGSAIRRKGWVGGTADTTLNALPFLGALKIVAEMLRGRDLIGDKRV